MWYHPFYSNPFFRIKLCRMQWMNVDDSTSSFKQPVLTYQARCLGVDYSWRRGHLPESSLAHSQRTKHRVLDTSHASGSGEEVSQWLTNCAEAGRRKRHTLQALAGWFQHVHVLLTFGKEYSVAFGSESRGRGRDFHRLQISQYSRFGGWTVLKRLNIIKHLKRVSERYFPRWSVWRIWKMNQELWSSKPGMKKVLAELFALDNFADVLFIVVGWWELRSSHHWWNSCELPLTIDEMKWDNWLL